MNCNNCGAPVDIEHDRFCANCGAPLTPQQTAYHQPDGAPYEQPPYYQPNYQQTNPDDKGGCLWGGLGFLIPIVGLILYLVWRRERPKTAKACGIGALVGFILEIVFSIIAILISFTMATSLYLITADLLPAFLL